MLWIICSISIVIAGLFAGFLLARSFLRSSTHTLKSISLKENIEAIHKNADAQRNLILDEAHIAVKEQYAIEADKFDLERETQLQLQEKFEKELNEKQSETDKFASTLEKKDEELKNKKLGIHEVEIQIDGIEEKKQELHLQYHAQLEIRARQKKSEFFTEMSEELLHAEKLGISRFLIENMEALKTDAQKFARESLATVYHKYQPQFIWPKSSFMVALPKQELIEKYFFEDSPLIQLLLAGTASSLSVLTVPDEQSSMLKITAGAGVDKEIIRLTLEEMLSHQVFDENRIKVILAKQRHII